ncbi:50S ribosomal protein L24 [Salinispira pacifica]|uniref:Large ribosomal subunit protein uL24 n=1 Tax=Salinispira pacifica TaxID=1307761 RepID=V5WER3_9SPIO|nr:50S ribosomal protein L24 [Salinispira pacifica]AHC14308.1 LSU ribosomal protein L24p (L26e) [Salinispira pacifica]
MNTYTTKIKKNDQVMVVAGREKGKTGRVLRIDLKNGRILIEGVNMVKKAVRKKSQNDRGGIMEVEAPLHISNVQLVGKNGKPARAGFKLDGDKKVRVNAKTGEAL